MSPLRRRLRAALPPLALFALALVVRALPWRDVFTRNGIVIGGYDSFFHMRRIAWSIANFPAVQEIDPYIQFPRGARPISAPLFDWVIAAATRPWVGNLQAGGLERLERIAVWVPPLLGALTVVAAWSLARRHFGTAAAWTAGVLLALMSGHYWYSRIGLVDHHAAVALLATLVLACALGLLAARDRPPPASWGWAAGLGVATAALFLVWPGGLLHLALLDACLVAAVVAESDPRRAAGLALELAAAHLLAAGLVFPWSWGNEWPHLGRFAPVVLSEFQPWLLAAVAAALVLARAAWRIPALGSSRPARGGTLLALALLLLAASLLLLPGAADAVALLRAWLSRSEQFAFYQRIREAEPLLATEGGLSIELALQRLSGFVLVFPALVAWLAWSGRRDPGRARLWTLLFWASGLCVVTLLQRRFFNTFSVGVALVAGVAMARGRTELARRWPGAPHGLATGVVAAIGVAALAPATIPYLPHLSNQWAALRGEPPRRVPAEAAHQRQVRLARWLAESTPSPGGWLERDARPAYGILAPSDLGHMLKYVARRPVVVDNFVDDVGGDGYEFYREVLGSREPEAYHALVDRRVRYLVVPPRPSMLHAQFPPEGLFHTLGTIGEPAFGSPAADAVMPAHFRLLYEALARPQGARHRLATLRVWEVVPGARLRGSAHPGSEVTATLGLRGNGGRRLEPVWRTRADERGRWSLRVPYATTGFPASSLRPEQGYRVQCGGEVVPVRVGEQAVRSGADIAVPCPGDGGVP